MGQLLIVGPRPELPRRLEYYSDADKRIFSVRSGVTSPASILLADEEYLMNKVSDPEKFYLQVLMPFKIEVNLNYIVNYSLALDFMTLIATALKIVGIDWSKIVIFNASLLDRRVDLGKIAGSY